MAWKRRDEKRRDDRSPKDSHTQLTPFLISDWSIPNGFCIFIVLCSLRGFSQILIMFVSIDCASESFSLFSLLIPSSWKLPFPRSPTSPPSHGDWERKRDLAESPVDSPRRRLLFIDTLADSNVREHAHSSPERVHL